MSLLLLLDHPRTVYTRGTATTLPTTGTNMPVSYSYSDYAAVAADDSTYVGVTGQPYLIHAFDYYAPSNTQPITLTWNGNSTIAGSVRPAVLQIWNINTSSWETIASSSTFSTGVDFTLTGSRSSNLSYYYDANNVVMARVYQ